MKKTLWALSAMAVLGLGMAACDEDDLDGLLNGDQCANDDGCTDAVKKYCVQSWTSKKVCSDKQECQPGFRFDDKGDCVNDPGKTNSSCDTHDECNDDEYCKKDDGAAKGVCTVGQRPQVFEYVRIDDGSTIEQTWDGTKNGGKGCFVGNGKCVDDPGADIDAIILKKKNDATLKYAKTVVEYNFGGKMKVEGKDLTGAKSNVSTDPRNALGEPDSIEKYGENDASCKLYIDDASKNCFGNSEVQCEARPFVSLGGAGGYLIVEMNGVIEAEDTIQVLELGDCSLKNCNDDSDANCSKNKAIKEEVKVYVSVNDKSTEGWKMIGDSGKSTDKGVISFVVAAADLTKDDASFAK